MHLWKQEKARLLYPTMKIHVELAEKMICFFWGAKNGCGNRHELCLLATKSTCVKSRLRRYWDCACTFMHGFSDASRDLNGSAHEFLYGLHFQTRIQQCLTGLCERANTYGKPREDATR